MKKLFAVVCLFLSFSAMSNPLPDFPFVIVSEHITKQVKPDSAKVNFSIIAFDKSSSKASEKLNGTMNNVLNLLKSFQISTDKLESYQVRKRAKRAQRDREYNLEILGYDFSQDLTLTLDSLKRYPELMDELLKIDGVDSVSPVFETSKAKQIEHELIKELSDKARAKADYLASVQSRKVKSLYGVTTDQSFSNAMAKFSLRDSGSRTERFAVSGSRRMTFSMFVPEYIEINQNITAIYKLK